MPAIEEFYRGLQGEFFFIHCHIAIEKTEVPFVKFAPFVGFKTVAIIFEQCHSDCVYVLSIVLQDMDNMAGAFMIT